MKTLATYHTRTGKTAFEVRQHGPRSFSYTGTCGAGCTQSLDDIAREIRASMRSRRGIHFVSGIDITTRTP